MKTRLIGLLLMIFILASCEKNCGYRSEGLIIGYDYRKCMCCGGFFIDIEDSTYRFDQWPEDFNFDWDLDTFPMSVLIDWQVDSVLCLGDEILVSRIKRIYK